jgi:hypothetical protein
MKYYLAYGSNLNKEQMRYRCPTAVPVGTAEIHNCKLVFRRGVLTIEPEEGSSVPVGVWEITRADEKALDRYEGYPHWYYKKTVRVWMNECMTINGMVYIMTEGHPIRMPSRFYLETVYDGYCNFGFSKEEREKLLAAAKSAENNPDL